MTLSEINVYPVKGLAGMRLDRAFVEFRGLRFDRRWMVVDGAGVFLSQRSHPKMATLKATVLEKCLQLSAANDQLCLPLIADGQERMVRVWKSEVLAQEVSPEADEWLGNHLGFACTLVQMPEKAIRPTNSEFSRDGDHVSFADGYPLLLANDASLKDLNGRLDSPVPMNRFRPNLVVTGSVRPWAEDDWHKIQIGGIEFRCAKPCGRCQVTTIDQSTGVPSGDEPLRTLATFRKVENSVNFAINLIPDGEGWIGVGETVQAVTPVSG
ncbi:MAG TPA: MOSC N-terminal beta barrel domain-containing protein [Fimbriimonas sp.]|nr:MOSC N-terminal beta barrel domain-containing protein [Fimbriimonas sp.]